MPAASLWIGRILSALAVLFLLFDSVIKLLQIDAAITGAVDLGYTENPESAVLLMGVLLLISLILYVIPQTSVLGAVLITGYLGGAIAIHVRLWNPLFSHTLFPVYVALFVWGGLYLRNPQLRKIFPFQR